MIMFDYTDLCYIDAYLFWKESKYDYIKLIILYFKSLLSHLLTFFCVKFWFCLFLFLKNNRPFKKYFLT